MKTLKKIAMMVAVAMISAAAFAMDYSGDMQFQIGWQGAIDKVDLIMGSGDTQNYEFKTNAVYISLSNWNFGNVNNYFAFGFYDKLDFSFGRGNGTDDLLINYKEANSSERFAVNFIIGPAVKFNVENIVALHIGAGFAGGYEQLEVIDDSKMKSGVIGVAADIQAKFLPSRPLSPLFGFQYAYRTMDNYKDSFANADLINNINKPFNAHTYALYAALSFNFGTR